MSPHLMILVSSNDGGGRELNLVYCAGLELHRLCYFWKSNRMAAIQISMDVSAHKVGCDLGQSWPICNMLVPLELRFEPEPIYRPRISAHSSPYALYLPVFYSKLDMDISVNVRRVAKSHRCAAPGGTLYSIREYLAEPNGETLHPIQGLLGLFSTWGLHQRQVKHLLLPIQCFLDVDKRLFYTVSEDAYLTLEGLRGGLKQWSHGSDEGYFALCHDEIWSIMHQVCANSPGP